MIEALERWVSNIAAIVFFVVLIEILLPSGKTKKYIGFVTGILVVVTIMSPVVKALGGELKFDLPDIGNPPEQMSQSSAQNEQRLNMVQSRQVMRVYTDKLESSIKEQLIGLKNAKCSDVECEVFENENSGKIGEIKSIEVFISAEPQKEKQMGIKPLDININITKDKIDKTDKEVPVEVRNEVIQRITTMYEIEPSKINIVYINN